MKKWSSLLVVVLSLFLCHISLAEEAAPAEAPAAQEPEKSWTIGAEMDLVSRYVWKGFSYSSGASLQPYLFAEWKNLGAYFWGNLILNNEFNQGQFSEIDYGVYYSFDLGPVNIAPSFNYYTYPSDHISANTGTIIVNLALPVGPISLISETIVDVIEFRGATMERFGIQYEKEIHPNVSLKTSSVFGIANGKFNLNYGFSDAGTAFDSNETSFEISWNAWKGLTLTPHVHMAIFFPENLRDDLADNPNVWGGLRVGYAY